MGRIPEPVLAGEFDERLRDMKRRHNMFWEEVKEGFLAPRLEKRYRAVPGWLRWWTKNGAKIVAIRITDMASDPLVVTLFPDRYSIDVAEKPPGEACFTVRVEKITLMNIGYGNLSPVTALLSGTLTVSPIFPLRDKIAFWSIISA